MLTYKPPIREFRFLLYDVFQMDEQLRALPQHTDLSCDVIDAILEQAGKLATEVILPTNQPGDVEGCRFENGIVRTPACFKQAYERLKDGGWFGIAASEEHGGMALPELLELMIREFLLSANFSFTDYVGLAQGAYKTILTHADSALRNIYLPQLATGDWGAAMCLTEPSCGTDLSLIRTSASPLDGGTYRIDGTKLFISCGDHDLAENIALLVLARIKGAPEGNRGLSLFLVPKFIPGSDGTAGLRNDVRAVRLEDKMGYHGCATCEMFFDGARAWLIGKRERGLGAMFTMINVSRLIVAQQGLAVSEIAYQNAAEYALHRLQGRALTGPAFPEQPADPLIVHPDVRRMLIKARAFNEGARALLLWTALQEEIANKHEDAAIRESAADHAALLTPVVKSFLTDMGFDCANDCLQVWGGHGYIRENGMEQLIRDLRIAPIQEGANGIQALDLVGRKLAIHDGRLFHRFMNSMRGTAATIADDPNQSDIGRVLHDSLHKLDQATEWITRRVAHEPNEIGAAGVEYQRVFGYVSLAWVWALMVRAAARSATGDSFYRNKLLTARFYMQRMLPMIDGYIAAMKGGAEPMMTPEGDYFGRSA